MNFLITHVKDNEFKMIQEVEDLFEGTVTGIVYTVKLIDDTVNVYHNGELQTPFAPDEILQEIRALCLESV